MTTFHRCFRPFKNGRETCNAVLRNVTQAVAEKFRIVPRSKICGSCRLKLTSNTDSPNIPMSELSDVNAADSGPDSELIPSQTTDPSSSSLFSQQLPSSNPDSQEALLEADRKLFVLGISPIDRKRLGQKKYCQIKRRKTAEAVQQVLTVLENSDEKDEHECEILDQLKNRFHSPKTTNSEKIVLLTLAPKSWSTRRIASEFQTLRCKAQLAKKLADEHGILTSPNPKIGKRLTDAQIDTVKKFYEDDQNSRMMPGAKDFVSCKQGDGKRVHCQKRLVLCNLSELYCKFQQLNPQFKIGFSKFAELRPPFCVLAGSSGTHCVCVCVLHENTSLMFEASQIAKLSRAKPVSLQSIQDCIQQITCNESTPQCFCDDKKNVCKKCPGIGDLAAYFTDLFDENEIDSFKFKVWRNTDRTTLRTEEMTSEEFLEEFCGQLMKVKVHDFIAKKQAGFVAKLKETLSEGEIMVQCDFAENYAFVAQNAVQAFHYNNDQATVYTVVAYYRKEGQILHKSLAIISDNLLHDSTAVYVYNKIIINFLKAENLDPKKIFYITDGGPSHFKNRFNFANLMHHESDFGIPAEQHFFATAHGKSACDGIGGNLKRQASRASLQSSTDDQILTPMALFEWAKRNLRDTTVRFSGKAEHDEAKEKLKGRFADAKRVPDTQKNHAFIPISRDCMLVKKFSFAAEAVNFKTKKEFGKGKK